uniref:Uncharacterized protein n=1 Tax=Lepeophtheirus salmonis TaxID=72036 RepID=A0A0K2SX05_LEPSM
MIINNLWLKRRGGGGGGFVEEQVSSVNIIIRLTVDKSHVSSFFYRN